MSGSRVAITGYHAIEEALKRGGGGLELWLADDRKGNRSLRAMAEASGARVVTAGAEELTRLASTDDHRGAVLMSTGAAAPARADLRRELADLGGGPRLVVVLDHISDPHNFGAVLRSADQFSADLVILPERRSVGITPAVARASAGASAHVRCAVVGNLASSLRLLKDARFWVYGAHLHGERLDRVRFAERTAIVLGSEGHGLGELMQRECDALARIPSTGHVDSLNVSVAAGIFMYEVRRAQGFFGD